MITFVFNTKKGVSIGYCEENNLQEVTTAVVPSGGNYLLIPVDEAPQEPQESWCIEDGEIKIDQDKLLQIQREQMPTLTPIEFDIKLNNAGLYDAVQDLIKDSFELRIAYTRATFFSRTDPFIDQARIALNLTDEQVDEMWMN